MVTYEDSRYFALDVLETKNESEALKYQQKIALGALLYSTSSELDMFLKYPTAVDYETNQLIDYHDPSWYLVTTIKETIIPEGFEGIVAVCRKVDTRSLALNFSVVVKGTQAFKVDILTRLHQIGVV